jgi:hypothetical protein
MHLVPSSFYKDHFICLLSFLETDQIIYALKTLECQLVSEGRLQEADRVQDLKDKFKKLSKTLDSRDNKL